jgi:hypothetical protein
MKGQGNILSTPLYFIQSTVAREIFESKEIEDKELGLMLLRKDEPKMSAGRV